MLDAKLLTDRRLACALLLACAPCGAQTAAGPAPAESGPVKIEKLTLSGAVEELSASDPAVLADLYRAASEAYVRQRKTDKAISLLEGYRRAGGGDPMLLLRLADLYSQRGAGDEALAISEELAKDHPAEPGRLARLVMLYRQKGALDKAAALLEKRAKADPKSAETWSQLAEVYRDKGDSARAAACLEKLIALEPRYWHYAQLARLRLQSDGLDAAVATLKAGMGKLPQEETEFLSALADLYAERGQRDKAAQQLEAALARTKDPARRQEIERRLAFMKQSRPAEGAAGKK